MASVKRRSTPARALLTALVSATLAACGGGGGNDSSGSTPPPDDGTAPPPSGGVDRGGLVLGTITGFGSVIVDGVTYDTGSAEIIVDDAPAQEGDLSVGYKVTVTGTVNDDGTSGVAERVVYDSDLEGPVESVDLMGGTLVAVGQTVVIVSSTVFDSDFPVPGLAGIAVGDRIGISGYLDADGRLVASRIELDDDDDIEVTGPVSNLDATAFTFTINDLTVDYAGAVLDDFDAGEALANGILVEVEGDGFGPNGELLATEIDNEDDVLDTVEDGAEGQLEGYVTSFVSLQDFRVNGRPVTTTDGTVYVNGTADAVRRNVRLAVRGTLDGTGVLVAERIIFELPSNLLVEATVDAIDLTGEVPVVTVLGIRVAVRADTQLEDDSDFGDFFFDIGDLAVGDYVEVRGAPAADGAVDIVATRIERENDEGPGEVELRGFVNAIDPAARSLEILGVTVVADTDDPEAFDELFASVAVGDLVIVEGVVIGTGTLAVEDAEFSRREDNDGDDDDGDDDEDDGGGDDD